MTVLKIALAGAANTGKAELANALSQALLTSGENAIVVVAGTPAILAGLLHNDLTLLMGLKVRQASPCPMGTREEAEDLLIRAALATAGTPYQVIYGAGEERLLQALDVVRRLLPRAGKPPRLSSYASKPQTSTWTWTCDKCSDPQCERRLLTALLAQRSLSPLLHR